MICQQTLNCRLLALDVLDVASLYFPELPRSAPVRVTTGRPLFFTWLDSARLLVHADASRLSVLGACKPAEGDRGEDGNVLLLPASDLRPCFTTPQGFHAEANFSSKSPQYVGLNLQLIPVTCCRRARRCCCSTRRVAGGFLWTWPHFHAGGLAPGCARTP